jgi:hypothetical protein
MSRFLEDTLEYFLKSVPTPKKVVVKIKLQSSMKSKLSQIIISSSIACLMFSSLIFTSIHAGAEDKLDGAFGIGLGQFFDPESAKGTRSLTDGTPMYRFIPENAFRSFSNYYVLLSPKSKTVYSIWGIGEIDNTEKCKKEQELIMTILGGKYGSVDDQSFSAAIYDTKTISQGNRNVLTKCSGFSNVSIEIRYTDYDLKELAEAERLELEVLKVDSSGL